MMDDEMSVERPEADRVEIGVLTDVRDMVDEFFHHYHAVNEAFAIVNGTTIVDDSDEARSLTLRLAKISLQRIASRIALAIKDLSKAA
jgi:hypothetical protein